MSLVGRLFTRAGEPKASQTLSDPWEGYHSSSARKTVSAQAAAALPAVWACVSLRADQISSLPVCVYTDRPGKQEKAQGTWQERLLRQPNPECSPADFWWVINAHLDLWGNAYAGKQKLGSRTTALWPIKPDKVTVRRIKGEKVFDVTEDNGALVTYRAADIVHFKNRSLDGFIGVSPITLHRQTVGLGIGLDEFGGTLIGNRAVPLGALTVKGVITDDVARENLRREVKARFGGARANEPLILDDGATYSPVSMPLGDMQYIEQRKMNGQDIARIYGVPPELIGYDSGGSLTYSTVESRQIAFVRYSLRPRLTSIEQTLFADPDLFSNIGGYYPKFDTDELLRGDVKSQYEALSIATGKKAFMTVNEARQRVDLDEAEGGDDISTPAPVPPNGPAPQDQQDAEEPA